MQFTGTFTRTFFASLLSVAAFALPQTIVHPGAPTPFSVINYSTACSAASCSYSFDVSGPASSAFGSAFSTHCTGTDEGSAFTACDYIEVLAFLSHNITSPSGYTLFLERIHKIGDATELMVGNYSTAAVPIGVEQNFVVQLYAYGEIVDN